MTTLRNTLRGGAACAVLLVVAACATTSPLADGKIAVARASVTRAEQAGAEQAAPVDLGSAREKLARAEKANADHDTGPAAILADQADIDARIAEATAQQEKSHKAAMDFTASMQALRQETQRNSQAAQ